MFSCDGFCEPGGDCRLIDCRRVRPIGFVNVTDAGDTVEAFYTHP